MNLLKEWISPKYLSNIFLTHLRRQFRQQKPFPYLELKNFFAEEKAKSLFESLLKEPFALQQADLFQFRQTNDFMKSRQPLLKEFRNLLVSEEFAAFLSSLTGEQLRPGKVDASGTLYEDTDFLLCHDDLLEGRKIAYFLYLSDLKPGDGGALHLFSSEKGKPADIAVRITPAFDTFAFFLVSENSFHEVGEVIKPVQRFSLSGWFYGK